MHVNSFSPTSWPLALTTSDVKRRERCTFPSAILSIEGDLWKKHRRFSLTALRDLGFGKTAVMEQNSGENSVFSTFHFSSRGELFPR